MPRDVPLAHVYLPDAHKASRGLDPELQNSAHKPTQSLQPGKAPMPPTQGAYPAEAP